MSCFDLCNRILSEDINGIVSEFGAWEELRGRTILVTGATGFIGSLLIKTLLCANDRLGLAMKIVGQGRSTEKMNRSFDTLLERTDLETVCTEGFAFDHPCDYIIHAAAPTASKFFVERPVETIDVSVCGARSMLELAKKYGARLLYLSSMEQYGISYEAGAVMTEDKIGIIDHLQVRSSYSESKRLGELYCAAYHAEYGVHVTIARLAQTFGPGVSLSDQRVFMQFAESVIGNKDIVLHTRGQSMCNFCYSADAVRALLTLLVRGKAGEAYNVCNDRESRSIAEVAALVANEVAEGRIGVIYDIPESSLTYGYAPDVTMRLCSDKLCGLGWTAKIDMRTAYLRLTEYLRQALEK